MEMESSEEGLAATRECIDRLQTELQRWPSCTPACIDSFRNQTAKLWTITSNEEKSRKYLASKAVGGLPLLLLVLEFTQDYYIVENVVFILKELLVSRSARDERVCILVDHGAIPILFHVLISCKQASGYGDEFMSSLYTVLARVGRKDKKFAVKARLTGVLPVCLAHIKYYSHKSKVLTSLLMLLKALLTSSVNATILCKDGMVPLLASFLGGVKQKLSLSTSYVVEALAVATRSKVMVRQVIKYDGLPFLLQLLDPNQWTGACRKGTRITRIFRATLQVFVHVSFTKNGRDALSEAQVIPFLLCWCQSFPGASEHWDKLATLVSLVVQRCLHPLTVPVRSLSCPFQFNLPERPPDILEYETNDDKDCLSSIASDESSDSDEDSEPVVEREDLQLYSVNIMLIAKFFPELENNDSQLIVENVTDFSPSKCKPHISQSFHNFSNGTSRSFENANLSLLPQKLQSLQISPSNTVKHSYSVELFSSSKSEFSDANLSRNTSDNSVSSDKNDVELVMMSTNCSAELSDHINNSVSCSSSSKGDVKDVPICLPNDEGQVLCKDSVEYSTLKLRNMIECAKEEKRIEKFLENVNIAKVYKEMAAQTKSVVPFIKIAYPDIHGGKGKSTLEPLYKQHEGLLRSKVLRHAEKRLNKDEYESKVVFSLDDLISESRKIVLGNDDEERIKNNVLNTENLNFESRFESGNLRKAIQIGEREYNLILNADINTNFHHQWFYFEISGMEADVPYIFNIVNMEKSNSLFNHGMLPLLYSVTESMQGNPGWTRVGEDVCYYRNHYIRGTSMSAIVKDKPYYTFTITICFQHSNDICYLAYHYPYTYSLLKTHLYCWLNSYDTTSIYFTRDVLCETLAGNPAPVLTITAKPPDNKRPYIFLTSRVHPGESNSSWVMKGTVDFLLSNKPSAQRLREMYIIKIVPMLNPDGVINGSHRCSLTGQDLNRQWIIPNPKLHPTIYHTKALLHYMHMRGKKPLVFCDFHGHSRRKNAFLYGCSPSSSWWPGDENKHDDHSYEILAVLLHHIAPAFSLGHCCFAVEKNRESTARIAVWRQFGVSLSYTMECSYGGSDQGLYSGYHLGLFHLEEMGMKLCQALGKLLVDDLHTLVAIDPLMIQGIRSAQRNLFHSENRQMTASSSQSEEDFLEDGLDESDSAANLSV